MSRILLADDSPHAQRMGERILREEGFEVVTVTDGETALIRLADVDPDVVMADVFLPHKSGYEICRTIKASPKHKHARVVLLAGLLEPVDDGEVERVNADAVLKKPFEASAVIATVRPLVEAAQADREMTAQQETEPEPLPEPEPEFEPEPVAVDVTDVEPEPEPESAAVAVEIAPEVELEVEPESGPEPLIAEQREIDRERVRAAVTIALDQAMPALIEELTDRVMIALK